MSLVHRLLPLRRDRNVAEEFFSGLFSRAVKVQQNCGFSRWGTAVPHAIRGSIK